MNLQWNDLFMKGSLIDVDIHVWRARIQLTATDLGLEDSEEVRKALSLGVHRLASADEFSKINSIYRSAIASVESRTFRFPAMPGVRFVPDVKVKDLIKTLEEHRDSFTAEVEKFMSRYDEFKTGQLVNIEKALKDAAKTDSAAATAFARVIATYPTPGQIRAKFGLVWRMFALSAPVSDNALDAAKTLQTESSQIGDVIMEMVQQLRAEVADKIQVLVDLAKRGERLPAKSYNSAMDLIQRVNEMNIFGDATLSSATSALKRLLESQAKDPKVKEDVTPNMVEIVQGLQQIKTDVAKSIEEAVAAATQNLIGVGRRQIDL